MWLADSNGIARRRVAEVLDIVGLSDVAGKRVGTFSLGMNQRLGIAAALLGDPETVMFDEPINGLDPEGILWIRNLMKSLASEGRTVFLSSHLMSEMAQTADHLIVIGRGRIIADAGTDEFINRHTAPSVRVRAVEQTDLAEALTQRGALIERGSDGAMVVTGLDCRRDRRQSPPPTTSPSFELAPLGSSLEEAYLRPDQGCKPTTTPASWPARPKEPDMSIATHTIDHSLHAPGSPVRTRRSAGHVKGEWTKLRTLPSTWRTAVVGRGHLAIGLGRRRRLSQAQPVAQHDRPAAPDVRPDQRVAVRGLLRRRRAARHSPCGR